MWEMPSHWSQKWFDETSSGVVGALSTIDVVPFLLPKTVPRFFYPRQPCSFHTRIQMFPTTNRHWNSRLIFKVGRCVLQLIQHPNRPQASALSIRGIFWEFSKPLMFPRRAPTAQKNSCFGIHSLRKIFRFKVALFNRLKWLFNSGSLLD